MNVARRLARRAADELDPALVSILLVDDNPAKRLALNALLAPLGYHVVEADSGLNALRHVMAQDFAVILLDVRMPVMDGFETAALIRQRYQSELTPIIFVTSHAYNEIMPTERYAEGAVDFIFAPVHPDELRAKVSVFAKQFIKAAELARKARRVQASADELRMLTEVAPVGIFHTDPQNRYVYTNPRWSEITGIPAEAAVGHEWDGMIGSDLRPNLLATSTAEFASGDIAETEISRRFELRRPDSTSRIVLLTSRLIPDIDGGIKGWVGTLADVTAEAGAEAAMADARDKATEASGLKSDFLANMSHEIRTPMNGVIGMTDLLLETDLNAHQRDYAETVRNSGEALLTIIDDILDFSKVEAGRLEIEEVAFNAPAIVAEVVDLLARSAQAKGLELVAVIGRSVPSMVTGDPGRFRQVLTNLIGNAIKFTHAGEIVVRLSQAAVAGTDVFLRVEVTDTGDGVAEDKLDVIFQPFVQADTSTSRKYGGTGLGLAISSRLVALMGGNCGVSSQRGAGSTFWFTICVHAEASQESPAGGSSEEGLVGIKALVVDDNATVLSLVSEYLTDWGMVVSTAGSGREAVTTMRTAATEGRPFAVAVIDRYMPDMDGLALRDAIVGDSALAAKLLLLTGVGQRSHLADPAESGFGAAVPKPVHREQLRVCLRLLMGLDTGGVIAAEVVGTTSASAGVPEAGRLLLAEDNPINQKVVLAMLSAAGYCVDTVPNGVAAVQAFCAQPYDAILMDCQMPEMNGYEATAAIRAREGPGRRIPIIAVTASARREDQERCLAEGMDAYISKPLRRDALMAVLAKHVVTAGA